MSRLNVRDKLTGGTIFNVVIFLTGISWECDVKFNYKFSIEIPVENTASDR